MIAQQKSGSHEMRFFIIRNQLIFRSGHLVARA